MAEPLPANVEKLLLDLQSAEAYIRKPAVEDIGKLTTSNEQIVRALIAIRNLDSNPHVRRAAEEALQNPEHSALLHQRPDLAENLTVQESIRELPPSANQKPSSSIKDFVIGFVGWFVINFLLHLVMPFNIAMGDITGASIIVNIFLRLVLNVLVLIGLFGYALISRKRLFLAIGVLTAFGGSLFAIWLAFMW